MQWLAAYIVIVMLTVSVVLRALSLVRADLTEGFGHAEYHSVPRGVCLF